MTEFVDLSHAFEDGMPGFRLPAEDGSYTEFTAEIRPFLTHEESTPYYDGQSAFEITEMRFQTSIGTYLDSPYHRYPDRRDIGEIAIDEVILPGVAIDATGRDASEAVGPDVLPDAFDLDGAAVLFAFGWDEYWGTDQYRTYPYISAEVIDSLIERNVALVGVDTMNVDDASDPSRPAHTRFLANDVLILENLTNVRRLVDERFRLFAVPVKATGAAAMPVRAFAELE